MLFRSTQQKMASRTLVETWYDAHAEVEEHRLDEGRLEFEVTMRVIKSCTTSLELERAKILDIGGGPGRYGRIAHSYPDMWKGRFCPGC